MASSGKDSLSPAYRTMSSLGLSSREAAQRFDRLQEKLVYSLAHCFDEGVASFVDEEHTIVVVPSLSMVDSSVVMQPYEERFLFFLLLLRHPQARVIYITSQPVPPIIIDYYLGLLPGVIISHARQRLFMLAPGDSSQRPLSEKILERPRFIERIRSLIRDADRAHLVPFTTSILERDLALHLGIPMYAADPRFYGLGSKSGTRRIFAEEEIPHPAGFENICNLDQLVDAISKLRANNPALTRALVKLNEGVSGEGNAMLDLRDLPPSGDPQEASAIAERARKMRTAKPGLTFRNYMTLLGKRGAVLEELLQGDEFRSPSVQLRVNPVGQLQVLSTHDQLLGGPDGQNYLGAKFPADPAYATAITKEAEKVGRRLAKEGVVGRFAIDFVVTRSSNGNWQPYGIEVNLRKGGTTHPFLTLKFLTGGDYNPDTAEFLAPNGVRKYFVASDQVKSPLYRSLTAEDLFDLAIRRGLHFDQTHQTGVVFHMMSTLSEHGRLGLTAVSDSLEDAHALYDRTVSAIEEEAAIASRWKKLPEF